MLNNKKPRYRSPSKQARDILRAANRNASFRKPGQPLGIGKTQEPTENRKQTHWYPGQAEMLKQRQMYQAFVEN